VITGFMGTGKTTTGRVVAARLSWRFVDTDALIVARADKPIPRIFVEDGEARFRAMERDVIAEMVTWVNVVVATGGGMLVNEINRNTVLQACFVVCLDADPFTIERRLSHSEERPLAANWRTLFAQRRSAYAQIPFHIDTSGRSSSIVAEEIIARWRSST